jgi:hypothetical protein
MKALADAFNLSVETMLEQTGVVEDAAAESEPDTEAAIKADPRLTQAQKEALLGVYRGFIGTDPPSA